MVSRDGWGWGRGQIPVAVQVSSSAEMLQTDVERTTLLPHAGHADTHTHTGTDVIINVHRQASVVQMT